MKRKKPDEVYVTLYEKLFAPFVQSRFNCNYTHFLESWVQFHWPDRCLLNQEISVWNLSDKVKTVKM